MLVHVVFSTKDRAPMILPGTADRLYQYVGGIVRAEKCSLLAIGGTPDHIHLLLLLHPSTALVDLLRVVKARSSGWVHQTFADRGDFEWQAGYAAFSVSQSNRDRVAAYIVGQQEHHRTRTFREEYEALLRKHGVDHDPIYLWR